jgi:hypothetical protein
MKKQCEKLAAGGLNNTLQVSIVLFFARNQDPQGDCVGKLMPQGHMPTTSGANSSVDLLSLKLLSLRLSSVVLTYIQKIEACVDAMYSISIVMNRPHD